MDKEWKVEAPQLAESLSKDFQNGTIIDDNGRRYLTEETVVNLNGLKIEIFSKEHPPPHFRVYYAGESANYTIKDCKKINGCLNKWEKNIRKWHMENKEKLIAAWNKTRPSDCPVGNYVE